MEYIDLVFALGTDPITHNPQWQADIIEEDRTITRHVVSKKSPIKPDLKNYYFRCQVMNRFPFDQQRGMRIVSVRPVISLMTSAGSIVDIRDHRKQAQRKAAS